jgi:hypothetical protein
MYSDQTAFPSFPKFNSPLHLPLHSGSMGALYFTNKKAELRTSQFSEQSKTITIYQTHRS